jgi:hypothetical protein
MTPKGNSRFLVGCASLGMTAELGCGLKRGVGRGLPSGGLLFSNDQVGDFRGVALGPGARVVAVERIKLADGIFAQRRIEESGEVGEIPRRTRVALGHR